MEHKTLESLYAAIKSELEAKGLCLVTTGVLVGDCTFVGGTEIKLAGHSVDYKTGKFLQGTNAPFTTESLEEKAHISAFIRYLKHAWVSNEGQVVIVKDGTCREEFQFPVIDELLASHRDLVICL